MEILMVEDSMTSATITIGALRTGGVAHRMTWLRNGEDGLNFVFRRERFSSAPRPDLILLDLGLPKVDGRELLLQIKSSDDLKTIPIVVMTASTRDEDRLQGERLDVNAFLVKPVDLDKFLLLVRELRQFWHEDMILPV
jgi:CheY-like chemotaxis protein